MTFTLITGILFSIITENSLLLTSTWAGVSPDVMNALSARERANDDYYKAVKKLGPTPSPSDLLNLKNQILLPAEAGLANSVAKARAPDIEKVRKTMDRIAKIDKSGGAGSKPATTPPAKTLSDTLKKFESGIPTPGWVLDGSKIPKEVEFKSKKTPLKK